MKKCTYTALAVILVSMMITSCASDGGSSNDSVRKNDETSVTTTASSAESCEIEMNSSKLFDGEKFDDAELVEKAVNYYDFVLDSCQPVEHDNRNGRKGMYIMAVLSDDREVYIPDFSDYYVSVDGQYYYDESGELTEFSNYVINLMTEKGYWKY